MTALSGGSGYPTLKFPSVGSKVSGTIESFADTQARDFQTKQPKFWPDGNPVMQVRLDLGQPDGSKGSLYIQPGGMMKAVKQALKDAGAEDVEEMGWIEVTRSGGQGKSGDPYTYTATYVPFDPAS